MADHTCERCGYSMPNVHRLVKHLSRLLPCPAAHSVKEPAVLLQELGREALPIYECEACKKVLSSKSSLQMHQRACAAFTPTLAAVVPDREVPPPKLDISGLLDGGEFDGALINAHFHRNDFVIDIEDVWKWYGLCDKKSVKRHIEKHLKPEQFRIYNDGGHGVHQNVRVTVAGFKQLCTHARTLQAGRVHDIIVRSIGEPPAAAVRGANPSPAGITTMEITPCCFIMHGGDNDGWKIRKTPENRVSVYDIIDVAMSDRCRHSVFYELAIAHPDIIGNHMLSELHMFSGQGQRPTPVIDVQCVVSIMNLLPGSSAVAFRQKWGGDLVRAIGGDAMLINIDDVPEPPTPVVTIGTIESTVSHIVMRGGDGDGKKVRKTPDNLVSVYDLIEMVMNTTWGRDTFLGLKSRHREVVGLAGKFHLFPGAGQKPTPIVDARGAATIINLLPGPMAAAFRAECMDFTGGGALAEVMVELEDEASGSGSTDAFQADVSDTTPADGDVATGNEVIIEETPENVPNDDVGLDEMAAGETPDGDTIPIDECDVAAGDEEIIEETPENVLVGDVGLACDTTCSSGQGGEVDVARPMHTGDGAGPSRQVASTIPMYPNTSVLLRMLKEKMTGEEQRTFVDSFHMYLHHDRNNAFVIELDDVWECLGFSRNDNAKRALEKHLKVYVHYKIFPEKDGETSSLPKEEQSGDGNDEKRGGSNKQRIMMTVNGFKQYCMSACTERASKVREYYITMEDVMFEYLRSLVPNSTEHALFVTPVERSIVSVERLRETEDLFDLGVSTSFLPPNCVYVINVGCDAYGNDVNKFGMTEDVNERMKAHRSEYKYMKIVFIISLGEYAARPAEDTIKYFSLVRERIIEVSVSDKKHRECFTTTRADRDIVTDGIMDMVKRHHGPKILTVSYKGRTEAYHHDEKMPKPHWADCLGPLGSGSVALEIEKEKTKQVEMQTNVELAKVELEKMRIQLQIAQLARLPITA